MVSRFDDPDDNAWFGLMGGAAAVAIVVACCFCNWAIRRAGWCACCTRKKARKHVGKLGIAGGATGTLPSGQRGTGATGCCPRPSPKLLGPCCCCFVFLFRAAGNKVKASDQRAESRKRKRERLGLGPNDEISSDEEADEAELEGVTIAGAVILPKERRIAERNAREAEEQAAAHNARMTALREARSRATDTTRDDANMPTLIPAEIKRDGKQRALEHIEVTGVSHASRGLHMDPEPEYDLHLRPLMAILPPFFPPSKSAGSSLIAKSTTVTSFPVVASPAQPSSGSFPRR